MTDLHGEVALVTGASRGIGAAIAAELANAGAYVVGTATSAEGAESIGVALGERGQGTVLRLDDPSSLAEMVQTLGTLENPVSVLVNNAGITRDGLLARMKDADWDAVIETNLSATFRLTRACLRAMMRARHGRIINITSIVGVTGNPGQANYAAAKAGLIGFSKSLAREVGSRGITVNTVAPGFIDTDMTRALSEEQREALLTGIPLGRLGEVSDIAKAVRYLACADASYITGETLHVNGGMNMA